MSWMFKFDESSLGPTRIFKESRRAAHKTAVHHLYLIRIYTAIQTYLEFGVWVVVLLAIPHLGTINGLFFFWPPATGLPRVFGLSGPCGLGLQRGLHGHGSLGDLSDLRQFQTSGGRNRLSDYPIHRYPRLGS